jgi:hypothetical protein
MKHIDYLFPKPNNLEHFIHPVFNQGFKYADIKESLLIAEEVLEKIIESKYKTVIYSESGTSPLIHIIKILCNKKHIDIKFIPFKTPRSTDINLYEMIMFYLSNEEKEEVVNDVKRKDILAKLTKINVGDYLNQENTIYDIVKSKINNKSLIQIKEALEDTFIGHIFQNGFLFFDEYINAGTILRNFKFYADLFGFNNNYKIGSYCMFMDDPEDNEMVEFALYNKTTELECYQRGAYPFENRIDIIGYYYFINQDSYQKIYLEDLVKEFKHININKLESHLDTIINKIDQLKILDKLKDSCKEEQVKSYLDNYDIIRYLFRTLEKGKHYEYLDQVYELYAPAWSPMPVIFHLDYWQAFENINDDLEELKGLIKEEYLENRDSVFYESLSRIIDTRKEYLNSLNELLEEL